MNLNYIKKVVFTPKERSLPLKMKELWHVKKMQLFKKYFFHTLLLYPTSILRFFRLPTLHNFFWETFNIAYKPPVANLVSRPEGIDTTRIRTDTYSAFLTERLTA